ncbi:VWA domain-containing protein [Sulfobacillus harzensis]|uniref:VWA domain-containing protein n=1 Tax=Sulfobacillus harzensis TaxID=2729629 RepID=A0A7Y0L7U7_9FIRM|nr:VWA domain-containing protein [Sulfobacillus harzensis]NMP24030.1 VWA domain-containing protein [Sulfobacillus harzensis]
MSNAALNLGILLRGLRRLHFALGSQDWEDALKALALADLSDSGMVRASLKAVWCRTHDETELFDAAFEAWAQLLRRPEKPPLIAQDTYLAQVARQRRQETLVPSPNWLIAPPKYPVPPMEDGVAVPLARGASVMERLSHEPMNRLSDAEMASLLLWRQPRPPLTRRSTRTRPGLKGDAWNPRETMRRGQAGDEWMTLWFDAQTEEPLPVTILLDMSGSMSGYFRPLIMFFHTRVRRERRLEIFAFSTRLNNITRALKVFHVDQALAEVASLTPDRGGGTRIAESLEHLWRRERGRGIHPNSRLVLISDGLEDGDGHGLRGWITRFERYLGRRIIWWNPYGYDGAQVRTASLAVLGQTADFRRIGSFKELDRAWEALSDGRK